MIVCFLFRKEKEKVHRTILFLNSKKNERTNERMNECVFIFNRNRIQVDQFYMFLKISLILQLVFQLF